ncbi:MAG TPA: pilus assembly protein [Candidatus Ozemobacteraceae bacterium]|nr:pilus assembly protein [Candidatus Ozemobacteraceae bacterium]
MKLVRRKGQALVEMALVLPFFIFILLTIIDLSRVFHTYISLNHQCVEAACIGTRRQNFFVAVNTFGPDTHTPFETLKTTFEKLKSPLIGDCSLVPQGSVFPPNPTPRIVYWTTEGVGTTAKQVRVTAQCDVNLFTPLIGRLFGPSRQTYRVTAESTHLKE